jgi:hypothetical protein
MVVPAGTDPAPDGTDSAMTAATRSTTSPDPIVLLDVDDLAEADLDADLAERLELDGRVFLRPDGAVSLAEAIRRGGAAAASVHDLVLKAAQLAG